jgi:hypothetical protein
MARSASGIFKSVIARRVSSNQRPKFEFEGLRLRLRERERLGL